jgi:hypothetical protein
MIGNRSRKGLIFAGARRCPCAHCGVPLSFDEATVDHIDPRSMGGADDITNLAVTCRGCNMERDLSDFWAYRQKMAPIRALRRLGIHVDVRDPMAGVEAAMRLVEVTRAAVRGLAGRDSLPVAIGRVRALLPGAVTWEFVATLEERRAEMAEIEAAEGRAA